MSDLQNARRRGGQQNLTAADRAEERQATFEPKNNIKLYQAPSQAVCTPEFEQ